METIKPLNSLLQEAIAKFREEFQSEPQVAAAAPGRVNLIGEHTDYNDGFVLPMALPMVTVIVGSKISGEESIVVTTNKDADEPKKITIEMPNKSSLVCVCRPGKPKWANYIKGVIANYIGEKPSFMAVVMSSVPTGGGLSSSAALEVATYTFLDALNGEQAYSVMPTDKALACQKAEHDYAGMPCGVMDQFISMMGCKDHALLIDCRTLASHQVVLNDPEIVILITNSNVKHELTGSEYSSRRKQCEEAALLIKKISLRDATKKDIEYLKSINTDKDVVKRARHVVTEIERTTLAAQALKEKNYVKFGELMIESHRSLMTDFEVSCPEVDQLVDIALKSKGVLGSRMTGGGFGGCTVTMVYKQYTEKLIENIQKEYSGKATFYACQPSGGAKIISI